MIFERFEPLTKGEKRFFIEEIPNKVIFTIIFASFFTYFIIQLSYVEPFDSYTGLIFFTFYIYLALVFPYILVQFLIDIHNNQKKIFIFELTKKEIEKNSDNDYLLFHHERKFVLDRTIQNIEKFYEEITIGDMIELHQLPKSKEFVRIQKIDNTPKTL